MTYIVSSGTLNPTIPYLFNLPLALVVHSCCKPSTAIILLLVTNGVQRLEPLVHNRYRIELTIP